MLTLLVRLTFGIVEVEYTVGFSSRNTAFLYPDSNFLVVLFFGICFPSRKSKLKIFYPKIIQSYVPIGTKHDRLPSGLGKDWKYGAPSGNEYGYNPDPRYQPQTDIAEEIQKRMKILLDQTKKNIIQSYLKYEAYYNRKAKAAPLETRDHFENSDSVDRIKKKKCSLTITILSGDLEQIKRNYYTVFA